MSESRTQCRVDSMNDDVPFNTDPVQQQPRICANPQLMISFRELPLAAEAKRKDLMSCSSQSDVTRPGYV
ncbi:hypothetical protein AXG93_2508s1020 [Marchantia polymorpha subsp. ruderalis]|uniref:Uncharacterized protein n=1 Tax=Marchantia polymorpha subsp. ruderalis TaxID=1480154 RepID=A0A176WDI4_MARPO|nr:hypothetical protein AXG93_2508s1020 [Marchantia polymorpha subsp. ruderalis]